MGVTISTWQGFVRIAEILYIKCLVSGLSYSKCPAVEVTSNWEDLGRLPRGGEDTSEDLKDGKNFSWWKRQENAPYL